MRLPLSACAIVVLAAGGPAAQAPAKTPTADAIRAAVAERLGPGVDVEVIGPADALAAAPPAVATVAVDPSAWLGKPVRCTVSEGTGPARLLAIDLRVVASYAVAAHAVPRGAVLAAADLTAARGEVRDVPLRRLPTADALVGARLLRDLPAGAIVQASFVILRRVIEPGDPVTVVAAAGAVEVTAALVAADGGDVGDVIRVVNPDTRRYLRGRVVRAGYVEVIHEP